MRFKIAISALAVAALFGATASALAQIQPAPGASNQSKVEPEAARSSTKPGTTTGSATHARTNKGVMPNPPHQESRDAGNGRGK
jgi:hypothetical protein